MLRRLRSSDWGIVSSMKKAYGSPLFRLQEMISDLDNNSNREMLKYLFSSDSQFKEIIPIQFLLQLSSYRHLANNSNDSNDVAYPFSFPSEKKLFVIINPDYHNRGLFGTFGKTKLTKFRNCFKIKVFLAGEKFVCLSPDSKAIGTSYELFG